MGETTGTSPAGRKPGPKLNYHVDSGFGGNTITTHASLEQTGEFPASHFLQFMSDSFRCFTVEFNELNLWEILEKTNESNDL